MAQKRTPGRGQKKPHLKEVESTTNGEVPEEAQEEVAQAVQAPAHVIGPNDPAPEGLELPDYPYVPGYVCIPEQVYDLIINNLFQQPYTEVRHINMQLENVSQITKALRANHESESPQA